MTPLRPTPPAGSSPVPSPVSAHDRATALGLVSKMGGGERGARKLRDWATRELKNERRPDSQRRLASYIVVADTMVRERDAARAAESRAQAEQRALIADAMPVAERVAATFPELDALGPVERREVLNAMAVALATTPGPQYAPDAYFNRLGFIADRHLDRPVALSLVRAVIAERTLAGTLPEGSVFARGPGDLNLPAPDAERDLGHPEVYMAELLGHADAKMVERAIARLKLDDPERARVLEHALWASYAAPGHPHGLRRVEGATTEGDGTPLPLAKSGQRRDPSTTEWRAIYRAEHAQRVIAEYTEGMQNSVYGRTARIEPQQWLTDPQGRWVVIHFRTYNSCD